VVPVEIARELQARIPGSGFQELPCRGHYFAYDPDEMENLLVALLKAHRSCPGEKHLKFGDFREALRGTRRRRFEKIAAFDFSCIMQRVLQIV
jgi:hypothetical protein